MRQYLFTFYFFLTSTFMVMSQSLSIVDDLNAPKQGQGKIVLYQDESINGFIGKRNATGSSATNLPQEQGSESDVNADRKPSSYIQAKGYKIQVFSGNNQKSSKDEAQSKKNLVEKEFPGIEVVITFNSPVWRVRAGNFESYEEAFQTFQDMQKTFPSFGKEMQIVEAVIKLPVY